MASAAVGADADAAVPTCPEWTVRDLLRHTGAVHRWATGYVAGRRCEPSRGGLEEAAGTWPDDDGLTAWFEHGCADLVAALAAAPDDLECWTFLPAPSPRAMWARRQAHETAIHRVDTQLATGTAVTPCDPGFAADGIDELLTLFVPRRRAHAAAPMHRRPWRCAVPTTRPRGCCGPTRTGSRRRAPRAARTDPAPAP